ncbi:hypothetical protein MCEGE10_01921 [Flavobacteriaceae bacterium]
MKSALTYYRQITFLLFFICSTAYSQAPQGFDYQATVRNSLGDLITNQNVFFRFNIIQNSPTSVPIYTETHYVPTDDLGQISLTIGSGTPSLGTFPSINWGAGTYYLSIELNTGTSYVVMGVSQLLSVPYALYAKNAGNSSSLPNGTTIGEVLSWNGTNWIPTSVASTNAIPAVATVSASAITGSEATCGGAIASDGANNITSKGVCWSINPNPTTSDSLTNDGSGNMDFTSALTNLLPGTTYFYRAYAINSIGTGYGATYSFTTIGLPVITSNAISSVTNSSAVSGGYVSSDGGSALIAKGLVWDTNPNPTVDLTTKTIGGSGLGSFTSAITPLIYNTTYYFRAYATNEAGTSYGAQQQFTTVNFLSPNLDLTFNFDKSFSTRGTAFTLCGIGYDLDFYVLDSSFTDTGIYDGANSGCPERLTINPSVLADGTYYIFYEIYSTRGLDTTFHEPFAIPITVDYSRSGGITGTFAQESQFAPMSTAALGAQNANGNYVIQIQILNGVYTLSNSIPEVIASGRHASADIQAVIAQARINNGKP